MDENTQKMIDEQIEGLPNDVREAIISVDFKTKLQEITKRQKLLIDQAGKLEMETTLVMIGLEPLADYVDNLQRELEIPLLQAREIALDISENIFKPIRESLQEMNDKVDSEEENIGPNDTNTEIIGNNRPDETNLDRNQILNEIENPETIGGGTGTMNFSKNIPVKAVVEENEITTVATKIPQDVEIIPGQVVKDVSKDTTSDILKDKMTSTIITPQQIVNVKTETKLPEIEKKRPTSGVDPYREALS
jgi:hypothetical protein